VTPDRASVTRHIEAPAHTVFHIVSDPARHVEIDGSGMLRAAPGARPLTAVGQTFDIEMDRRPLDGVPNTTALRELVETVPDYLVRCTVTRLVPGRLIEWAVRAVGKPPAGHVWGWEIEPLTDGECLVSHYCDWTNISDELRAKFRWPVVPADRLAHSVENVKRLVTPDQG
jgi:Polyketide cyclase / dehydrase and lipid transport